VLIAEMKFFGRRKSGASALKDRARSAASLQRRVYPQNRLDRKIAFYTESTNLAAVKWVTGLSLVAKNGDPFTGSVPIPIQ
jgi:hypothetical protein